MRSAGFVCEEGRVKRFGEGNAVGYGGEGLVVLDFVEEGFGLLPARYKVFLVKKSFKSSGISG